MPHIEGALAKAACRLLLGCLIGAGSGCTRTIELLACWPDCGEACDDNDTCTTDDQWVDGVCRGRVIDGDGDGFPPRACGGNDCDDTSAAINPQAAEGPAGGPSCDNGLDDDCDGHTDGQDLDCLVSASGVCNDAGWCWQRPLPAGPRTFRAAWASSAENVWVAGDDVIVHRDATQWALVSLPAAAESISIMDISGAGPDDVWFVGGDWVAPNKGSAFHWDGQRIERRDPPTDNNLSGVWLAPTGETWAVGQAGAIFRWQGNAWSSVASPTTAWLLDIWGSSADDVWAIGAFPQTIIHWDGEAWSNVPISWATEDATLRSLWGSGPSDVWAVGSVHTTAHWDGALWQKKPIDASGLDPLIVAVAGLGPEQVFSAALHDHIVHWDGATWQAHPGGSSRVSGMTLQAMTPAGPDTLYAVGLSGRIVRYDGRSGQWANVGAPVGPIEDIAPVWISSTTEGWAATNGTSRTLLRWNGTQWLPMVGPAGGFVGIRALWSGKAGEVWVLDTRALLSYRDGAWTRHETPAPFHGLWGHGIDDIWICGPEGALLRFDGQSFTTLDTGTSANLLALWGDGDDLWAVGSGGTIIRWHYQTNVATQVPSRTSQALHAIWGATGRGIWALGGGVALYRDGDDWVEVVDMPGERGPYSSIWFGEQGPLWFAAGGRVYRRDGDAWDVEQTLGPAYIRVVHGSPDGAHLWAAGREGTIMHSRVSR